MELVGLLYVLVIISNPLTNAYQADKKFHWEFYVFLIAVFILSITATILAVVKVNSLGIAKRYFKKIFSRMFMYIAVFLISWCGPFVNEIYQVVSKRQEQQEFWKWWVGISVSLIGFGNAIVWLSNPTLYKEIKNNWILPCFSLIKVDEDKLPLLKRNTVFEDEEQDITRISIIFRRSLLYYLLNSIRNSLTSVSFGINESEDGLSELDDSSDYEAVLITETGAFTFEDTYPDIFHNIRSLSGISSDDYYSMLNPEEFLNNEYNQKFSDGKSGSFFCFSSNKRLIVKTIPKHEADCLKRFMKDYYRYLERNNNSLLMRVLGLYSIHPEMSSPVHVIVMLNTLWHSSLSPTAIYDLKGSYVDRGGDGTTNKDCDLKEKLALKDEDRVTLLSQLTSDATFLSNLNIMDYSLLLGIYHLDEGSTQDFELDTHFNILESSDGDRLFFFGVIDILQSYNKKKKLERCFKTCFLCKDGKGISAINPKDYKKRFLEFIQNISH